jgi:hypothetical protein
MNTTQEDFCVVGRRKKICGVMGNREARESGSMRRGKRQRQKQRTGRVNLHP